MQLKNRIIFESMFIWFFSILKKSKIRYQNVATYFWISCSIYTHKYYYQETFKNYKKKKVIKIKFTDFSYFNFSHKFCQRF